MTVPVQATASLLKEPRAALIEARNKLRDVIVQLRGGHATTTDAADEALASLDIAIGLVGARLERRQDQAAAEHALQQAQEERDEALSKEHAYTGEIVKLLSEKKAVERQRDGCQLTLIEAQETIVRLTRQIEES